MADELVGAVLDRASRDPALSDAAKMFVLAALEGADGLDQAVTGASRPEPPALSVVPGQAEGAGSTEGRGEARPSAARAYLSRITVTGFRGVGPEASIEFHPGPGLTVVAGRNGCGKSSFAEALELALTRRSYRWAKRTAVWSESWRNLRRPDPVRILVRLAEEGVGVTTVCAEWAAEASLNEVTVWTQRPGGRRAGLEGLGWDRDLELFRPFLSYDELGALFAEPSKLHDALACILGLDRLEDAVTLLGNRSKEFAAPGKEAAQAAKGLKPALAACSDDRARQASLLLKSRSPDLAAMSALATGAVPADPQLAGLHLLAAVTGPDLVGWHSARAEHDAAVDAHREALAAAGAAALSSTALLRAAVEHYEHHGDGACPVCGTGTLDAAWARQSRESLDRAGMFSAAADDARARVVAAREALSRAVPPVPAALERPPADLPDGVPLVEAAQAWRALQAVAADPDADSEVVLKEQARTVAAVDALAATAQDAVAAREDDWRPLALRLAQWLAVATRAAAVATTAADLAAAHLWLRRNTGELRNDRLAPLAVQAKQIWATLRQESNVELDGLSLQGAANRRHVELSAAVDGEQAQAFGVMSQGELHALALALFLPRATAPDSPFGFLVIDDPVQAMDPAKVDGLALVLHRAAQDRQVIVLTHDDRLPEAVRRLQLPARLLEVTRDEGSVVTVSAGATPAQRYLSDARAIASDRGVPDDVARRTIPTLCRLAMESACRDLFFRARLHAGGARADVEEEWSTAGTTRKRLALAVGGTTDASLDSWLTTSRRRSALGICTTAVHEGLKGQLHGGINDVQATLDELAGSDAR